MERATRVKPCALQEVDTAIRWQEFAPVREKTVTQAAPAIMAHNTPLPQVTAGENAPFVVCSLNPTRAYSIAAVRRYCHLADTEAPAVVCQIGNAQRIGIFGSFATLTFSPDTPPTRITAQCLFGTKTVDATNRVLQSDGSLIIDSALLTELCAPTDASETAVMLILE